MLLTDLNGPMSLQPRRPGSGRILRPIRFAAPAILFLSFATFGSTISRAQDQSDQGVADAARKERARKQELQKRAKHVYTEEDLKHPNILTPDDRAQIEAKRNECAQKNNCSPAPSQNPPASLDANSPAPGKSLGEVARQLRTQKELQALKPKQTEPFHLPFSTPALASPILPERPAIRPPAQPALHPKTPSDVFRRDPFSAVPIRPEVRRPEVRRAENRPGVREDVRPDLHTSVRENIRPTVHPKVSNDIHPKVREDVLPAIRPNVHPDFGKDVRPTLHAPARLAPPALPRISSRTATPNILIQPMLPSAPAKPAQRAAPIAPISTIRPGQSPVLAKPVQPVAPGVAIRPVQPKRPLPSAALATPHTVRVRPGDSLWKLAQQNLGRGNRWTELLASNPRITDPNQIRAGAQLNLPVVAAAVVSSRSAKTNAVAAVKVRKGDTLWTLAKSNLGRSSAWPCLAAANPSLADPNRIYQGQLLVVPSACSSTRSNSPSRSSP
jgi:nucleoid-associated protein YgaU